MGKFPHLFVKHLPKFKRLVRQAISADRYKRLILITATPVIEITGIEKGKLILGKHQPETADAESFASNDHSTFDLFQVLLDQRPVMAIILSGDVHYSFAIPSCVQDMKTGAKIDIVQFTSSALKNSPTGIEKQALDLLGKDTPPNRHRVRIWWRPDKGMIGSVGSAEVMHGILQEKISERFVRKEPTVGGQLDLTFGTEAKALQAAMKNHSTAEAASFMLLEEHIKTLAGWHVVPQNNVGYLRMQGLDPYCDFFGWDGSTQLLMTAHWSASNWPCRFT